MFCDNWLMPCDVSLSRRSVYALLVEAVVVLMPNDIENHDVVVDLPLRCRCGRVRGVASDVSPSTGFRFVCYCKDCQAFARFLERADVLDSAGGTDIFQMPPGRVKLTGARKPAVPAPLQQGFALVHRLLPDPDCQHGRRAGLPVIAAGSFVHGPRGRQCSHTNE